MKLLIAVMLGSVGVIHLLALAGVHGADRLSILYGLRFDEPNLKVCNRSAGTLQHVTAAPIPRDDFSRAPRLLCWFSPAQGSPHRCQSVARD